MKLVRVIAPHFVAGFESDGVIRRVAPILKYMVGWTDDRAREYIAAKGWKASVVPCLILDTTTSNKPPDPD